MFGAFAFYPSLAYNICRNYLQPKRWPWYNRVDEAVLLGALPFQSTAKELVNENVGGVVCCTEEYETKAGWTAMRAKDWAEIAVRLHQVPMKDFTGSTSRSEIQKAVEFINDVKKTGKSVFSPPSAQQEGSGFWTTRWVEVDKKGGDKLRPLQSRAYKKYNGSGMLSDERKGLDAKCGLRICENKKTTSYLEKCALEKR